MATNVTDITKKDPIVERAIGLLEGAASALRKNNRYNSNGITYPDYMVNGLDDVISRLLEPLLRVSASKSPSQAVDVCGYAALGASYLLSDAPPSKFNDLIEKAKTNGHEALTKGEQV
jgi:hypothetical protein